MKRNWWKWALGAFAGLVVLGALIGEPEESKPEGPPPKVRLDMAATPASVKGKSTTLIGAVKPATARVTVDAEPKTQTVDVAADGTFRMKVRLPEIGANPVGVEATARGRRPDSMELSIERELTAAEIAAKRERARQRRIQAAAERERRRQEEIARQAQAREDFIASATTIDYDELAKNPDDYKGTKVAYTGQIFQIQEDYGVSVILLSVTDMGYDIWDDNIWVDYPGEIQGAEEDIITVYGVVKGEQSYETQIGGETYVPKIQARYITE